MSLNGPHHHHHHGQGGGKRYGGWGPYSPVIYADPYPVFIEETPRDEIYRGYRIHQAAANVFVVFKPGIGGEDLALGSFVSRAEAHTFIDGHVSRSLKGLDGLFDTKTSAVVTIVGAGVILAALMKKGIL
jgi:hypothetical protein